VLPQADNNNSNNNTVSIVADWNLDQLRQPLKSSVNKSSPESSSIAFSPAAGVDTDSTRSDDLASGPKQEPQGPGGAGQGAPLREPG